MQIFQRRTPGVLRNAAVSGARIIDVPKSFEEEDKTFKPMDFTDKTYINSGGEKNLH